MTTAERAREIERRLQEILPLADKVDKDVRDHGTAGRVPYLWACRDMCACIRGGIDCANAIAEAQEADKQTTPA